MLTIRSQQQALAPQFLFLPRNWLSRNLSRQVASDVGVLSASEVRVL